MGRNAAIATKNEEASRQYRVVPTEDEDSDSECVQGEITDIVQFSCAIYYVEEIEAAASIDLMRLGTMEGAVSVKYTTIDGSGKAGARYEPVSGKVTFLPGEYLKTIVVPIVCTSIWSPTLEFMVQLSDPRGCELGVYLNSCRAKVIDYNTFPSSKYHAALEKGLPEVESISGAGLFLEYCKLNYFCPGMAWRTILILVMDQLHNLYRLLVITLRVYMVDTLFAMSDPTSEVRLYLPTRLGTSYLVAVCFVAPICILHAWDLIKLKLDVDGRSRLHLSTNLFREYLNYSDHSRNAVRITDIQNALLLDCNDIAHGYTAILNLVQLVGKICVLFFFTMSQSSASDRTALYCVIIMPIMMGCFGLFRSRGLILATEKVTGAASAFSALVSEACETYRLFANYFQRPLVNSHFVKTASDHRAVELPLDQIKLNDDYFTRWVGPLFVSMYIVLSTPMLVDGQMAVGVFLASCDILLQISQDFGTGYIEIMNLYQRCDTLRNLSVLFNMPSDLLQWKSCNRLRRNHTKESRDAILRERAQAREQHLQDNHHSGEVQYLSDSIPISMANLGFCLPSGKTLFSLEGRLEVAQGKLVALKGQHGSGKRTLLRLLAHELFPTTGDIFVPSHLRILHVTQEFLLLKESAWTNLIFGCKQPLTAMDLERIELVTGPLGMNKIRQLIRKDLQKAKDEHSLGHFRDAGKIDDGRCSWCPFDCGSPQAGEEKVKEKDGDAAWQLGLTYTEKVKLHLARAFLMNPEVMVLQRPLHHFSAEESKIVMRMLRDHVNNKGIGMPEGSRGHRRPRSVFYTAEMEEHEEAADLVWEIQGSAVVERSPAKVSRKTSKDCVMFQDPDIVRSMDEAPNASPQRASLIAQRNVSGANGNQVPMQLDKEAAGYLEAYDSGVRPKVLDHPPFRPNSTVPATLQPGHADGGRSPSPRFGQPDRSMGTVPATPQPGHSHDGRVLSSRFLGPTGTVPASLQPLLGHSDDSRSSTSMCEPLLVDSGAAVSSQHAGLSGAAEDSSVPKLELIFGSTSYVFNKHSSWISDRRPPCDSADTTARSPTGGSAGRYGVISANGSSPRVSLDQGLDKSAPRQGELELGNAVAREAWEKIH